MKPKPPPLTVERVVIRNFKNIVHLDLDLGGAGAPGPGRWTCLAGINGAGKSAVLQAICAVLLGPNTVPQLGAGVLASLPRRSTAAARAATIAVTLRVGGKKVTSTLSIRPGGGVEWSDGAATGVLQRRLGDHLVAAYGSSRNLSPAAAEPLEHSPQYQRVFTLFDPGARIRSAAAAPAADGCRNAAILATLKPVLQLLLDGADAGLQVAWRKAALAFQRGSVWLRGVELPDGYRSTVAWLADLCHAWHTEGLCNHGRRGKPEHISGVVLLDEIDLHLHPSLQRKIIPRLRQALPGLHFIVTTHSPLILACFDRSEIVALEPTEDGSVRRRDVDRQIYAFSTDQIYAWLMGTSPHGAVIEEKLAEGTDPELPLYLYQSARRREEDLPASEATTRGAGRPRSAAVAHLMGGFSTADAKRLLQERAEKLRALRAGSLGEGRRS